MVELAVRDGFPPPSGLPDGDCIMTQLADGRIRIDHADPRILISGELLDAIARNPEPNGWLDTARCAPPPWRATWTGAILHIDGVNRTVIYRIREYVPAVNGYIAEWPD